ncbi:MAG: DUF2264 domain-containing protein [Mucinivorans sp.]
MKKYISILVLSLVFSSVAFAARPTPKASVLTSAQADRAAWVDMLCRISRPVLSHLSSGTLHSAMPVEMPSDRSYGDRTPLAHLEAVGRTICGLAPWLELPADKTAEGVRRAEMLDLALAALTTMVDSASADHIDFTTANQNLVDAAFLAQGLMRAPKNLWAGLDSLTQRRMVEHLRSTRRFRANENNWLLFSAMIEAFFHSIGEPYDIMRVDYPVREHQAWYKGDGAYGDGRNFHWDYYNSFVIQPMLVDIVGEMSRFYPGLQKTTMERAARYAEVLERQISPEGTIPAIGRSLQYRTGAMQVLSQMALLNALPRDLSKGQVRAGLTALFHRFMDAEGTFDSAGWLRLGFCGWQPDIAEAYGCTGSLYLATVGFLALGLPVDDEFWTVEPQPWTSRRAWSGEPFARDEAIR